MRFPIRLTSRRLLCALPLLAGGLPAQSNAERMANDRYSRSHDYDLLHQRIEVGGFDWDSLSLNGRVTTTVRALRPAFDSVILDAGEGLEIRAVRGAGRWRGARLAFSHVRDTLVVRLARPLALGDTVSFEVEYHARIRNGHGLTFIEADSIPPRRPQQIWSQGEDDNNHAWFPTYDFPNDRTTWEVIATVPRGFAAVSNGRLITSRANRDGTRTVHWRQERPAVTYLVSLVVSRLVKLSDRWRGVPLESWVYPWDTTAARRLFRDTPDMIEVYTRLTGTPYPWPRYAQVTVADFFGGMENVGATTLVDWLPDARAWADRPWYHHILIPHELAHQWFGNYVTTANWAHMWLNEGFAEFLPGQYWAERLGRHAAEDYYLDEYQQFLQIDTTRRMPLAALGSNNIYPKGALVLEMLRRYLGPERFWAGVRRYLADHALGTATTDDLRQAFLEATGENLDWFFDQWIYQAGMPEFRVTAAWDAPSARLTLTVSQQQWDTLPTDSTGLRYTVPAVFRMPVSVRVGTAAGDTVLPVELSEREQTVPVDGLAGPPTMVVFDDGNRLLKRLTFEQPTAWLAAQLDRDSDLWNRWWVIGQLASRRDDAAARTALAHAATGADYFLTRVQAVRGLGGFEGEEVVEALLAAMRDSSAQVRSAATEALASHQGPAVQAALRAAWRHDTSDAVRAAALPALARQEPTEAVALIREGLRTPSYRDAIQDAALDAAFQLGDPVLLDDIDRLAGTSDQAAWLLAALGAHGDRKSLGRLGSHALSTRTAERRRALQAVTLIVPGKVAREWLKELHESTSDRRIRADIEAAATRLTPSDSTSE